jgi:5-dehydro-2-deoxygluconokinase
VQYHPDDAIDNRLEQEAQIRALYDAVQASGHELLLEIVPPKSLPRERDTVYRALKRLYNLGIHPEWWKLEPMDAAQWSDVDALLAERDPHCRGVLILGQSASIETLGAAFRDARGSATCRGFAVGRTIFGVPSRQWLAGEIDDAALVRAVRANFEALIDAWQEARTPLTTTESWSQCRA